MPVAMSAALSPTEQLWRKVFVWVGLPVVGLVVVVFLLLMFRSDGGPDGAVEQPTPAASATSSPASSVAQPSEQQQNPPAELPSAGALAVEWVPDDARLVVSFAPSRLADRSGMDRMLEAAEPYWQPVLGRVLAALALRPGELRRVTWSTGTLRNPTGRGVIVIEVEPDCDLGRLATLGVPAATRFRGVVCHRLTQGDWQQPFAVLGPHTIVTGSADVLEALGSRGKPRLASRALAQLIEAVPREAELSVLVDLASARRAGWPLPERAMAVWPIGERSWQMLWRRCEGLGLDVRLDGGTMHTKLDLVCPDAAAAEAVLAAVERLVPGGRSILAEKAKQLAPEAKGPQAEAYALLVHEAASALEATRWEPLGTTVRVWTDWAQDFSGLGLLVLDTLPEIEHDWVAAGTGLIDAQESRLLAGLDDYRRLNEHYPAAAVGGALLAPETRLSWIATLLSYYGHRGWHEQLEFGYRWDDAANEPVAKQVLPEVVNPLFGPATAEDGFPVTHFVGSAGVGPDAGRLSASDPRSGMFGFGRTTQLSQIRDGASNTIAILGVSHDCGPWAAGGRPTVRGLTERPYVNGPDGFGTGQPDGMLVGMADGSVRFLSKDVDPRVVEQLATIAGGEAPVSLIGPNDDPPSAKAEARPAAADPAEVEVDPDAPEPKEEASVEIPREVAARLARPVEGVAFDQIELGNLVHLIREMSALDIQFDQASLARAGISLDTPVAIKQSKTTVGRLLADALDQCGLVFVVREGRLVVVGREAETSK